MANQTLKPGELVVELWARCWIAVGKINRGDDQALDLGFKIARLFVICVARQTPANFLWAISSREGSRHHGEIVGHAKSRDRQLGRERAFCSASNRSLAHLTVSSSPEMTACLRKIATCTPKVTGCAKLIGANPKSSRDAAAAAYTRCSINDSRQSPVSSSSAIAEDVRQPARACRPAIWRPPRIRGCRLRAGTFLK